MIADGEAAGQAGQHWQRRGCEDAHDVGGRRAGLNATAHTLVIGDGVGEVRDEAGTRRHRRAGRGAATKQLRVRVRVSLAGVGARQEVSAGSRRIDLIHGHLIAAGIGIRLVTGQAFERLASR